MTHTISFERNCIIDNSNGKIDLKIIAATIFGQVFAPFDHTNSRLDEVTHNEVKNMYNPIQCPAKKMDVVSDCVDAC